MGIVCVAAVVVASAALIAIAVVLNDKINAVNATVSEALEKIKDIREDFHKVEEIHNLTSIALTSLNEETDKLFVSFNQLANLVHELAWTGTKVQHATI